MKGIYRAKVLDNDDPLQLGRVKVEVYPMLIGEVTALQMTGVDGISIEALPWAVPAFPLFEGAGSGHGFFSVPKVDSFLFVFFESEDIYQPVYFAEAPDGVHGLPSELSTNYPDNKVWKTKNGIIIEIDSSESNPEVTITHPKGTVCAVDANGNLSFSVSGTVNVVATGEVSISGSKVNIN